MRVGLVLGAGGVLGGAWLTGGLHALAEETGWDPGSADFVVGTSAGSMIGALAASGVPPWFMVAHSAGESFEGVNDVNGRPSAEADRSAGANFGLHRGALPLGPGSIELVMRTLRNPRRHTPAAFLSGWLPRGVVSTDPLKRTIRRVVPEGWADHPNLWIVACDYGTARRVVFGREGAPDADLADAVAASCAIPGFYHPVEIDGRRYVDGGMYSNSNLDVLRDEELDLVVCLNPTSTLHPPRAADPLEWVANGVRGASGRRLGREARRLRDQGTDVALIQPTAEDIALMGWNLMARRNRHKVVETAVKTVREQLQDPDVRASLEGLPQGAPEMVRRPPGPPSTWPVIGTRGVARSAVGSRGQSAAEEAAG